MKSPLVLRLLPVACCGLLSASPVFAQERFEFPQPSPHATLKARAGLTDIEVDYSRPGVKGREIFGNVVKWDQIWRTGANESTKISFSRPVKFGGVEVPAGKYALYTIPNQNEWTVILSTDTTLWGSDKYSADKDAVRVKAKPAALAQKVESFTIDVGDLAEESATLWIAWDKTAVPVKISVATNEQLLSGIQQAVASGKSMPPQFYSGAAMYYLAQNKDLPTALKWITQASGADPKNFRRLRVKAQIQAKLGDKTGAIATLEKANEVNKASAEPDDDELAANRKLLESWR
jgi:Protein of unknown function (DUF2911)